MPQTKDAYVCNTGNFILKDENPIELNNRAFLYADGFFETMFANGSEIPFFDYHYLRIQEGIKIYKLNPVNGFSKESLKRDIEGLITRNKSFYPTYVRITFFRQSGGKYGPLSNNLNYLITTSRLDREPFKLNEKGLLLGAFKDYTKRIDKFSSLKNISSQVFIFAAMYKQENNLDDCLIYNDRSEICEVTSSNVFVVKGKTVLTPPLSSGCVNGTMRKVSLECLKELNYNVNEVSLNAETLLDADECFITNSLGIKWVLAYKHKRYLKNTSYALLKQICSKYSL